SMCLSGTRERGRVPRAISVCECVCVCVCVCMICTCVCVVCETITFCFSYHFLWEQLTSIRQSIHIDGHVRNSTKHSKQLFSLIWSKAAAIVALPFEAWIDFCSLALLSFILPSLHPSLRTLSLSLSPSLSFPLPLSPSLSLSLSLCTRALSSPTLHFKRTNVSCSH